MHHTSKPRTRRGTQNNDKIVDVDDINQCNSSSTTVFVLKKMQIFCMDTFTLSNYLLQQHQKLTYQAYWCIWGFGNFEFVKKTRFYRCKTTLGRMSDCFKDEQNSRWINNFCILILFRIFMCRRIRTLFLSLKL